MAAAVGLRADFDAGALRAAARRSKGGPWWCAGVGSIGRPRAWPAREIMNAIFYVLRGGIAWRLPPNDFPPWQTVYRWFARLAR